MFFSCRYSSALDWFYISNKVFMLKLRLHLHPSCDRIKGLFKVALGLNFNPSPPLPVSDRPLRKAPPQVVVVHCFVSYNHSVFFNLFLFFFTKPAYLFSAPASSSSPRDSWTGLMTEAGQSAIHFYRLELDT